MARYVQDVDASEGTLRFRQEIFDGDGYEVIRDIVSRLGVADVRAFGLTWEDCEQLLGRLGCTDR